MRLRYLDTDFFEQAARNATETYTKSILHVCGLQLPDFDPPNGSICEDLLRHVGEKPHFRELNLTSEGQARIREELLRNLLPFKQDCVPYCQQSQVRALGDAGSRKSLILEVPDVEFPEDEHEPVRVLEDLAAMQNELVLETLASPLRIRDNLLQNLLPAKEQIDGILPVHKPHSFLKKKEKDLLVLEQVDIPEQDEQLQVAHLLTDMVSAFVENELPLEEIRAEERECVSEETFLQRVFLGKVTSPLARTTEQVTDFDDLLSDGKTWEVSVLEVGMASDEEFRFIPLKWDDPQHLAAVLDVGFMVLNYSENISPLQSLYEKLVVLPEISLGSHVCLLPVPALHCRDEQEQLEEAVIGAIASYANFSQPSATDFIYLDWHLSQGNNCNDQRCFYFKVGVPEKIFVPALAPLQSQVLSVDCDGRAVKKCCSAVMTEARVSLPIVSRQDPPFPMGCEEKAVKSVAHDDKIRRDVLPTEARVLASPTLSQDRAVDERTAVRAAVTHVPLPPVVLQGRFLSMDGEGRAVKSAAPEKKTSHDILPTETHGSLPPVFKDWPMGKAKAVKSVADAPSGLKVLASKAPPVVFQGRSLSMGSEEKDAAPPQKKICYGVLPTEALPPVIENTADASYAHSEKKCRCIFVANVGLMDRHGLTSRRGLYQRILNLEKEGTQVVERELRLPVDLILSPTTCFVLYSTEKLGLYGQTCSPHVVFSCIENIVDNDIKAFSFAFRNCILVFEGDGAFTSATLENLDDLYAIAIGLNIHVQCFVSGNPSETDSIVLSCVKEAQRSASASCASYPRMREASTVAEAFLTEFPAINTLTAHAILSSGRSLSEFISMESSEQLVVCKPFEVPRHSLHLFKSQCEYGEQIPRRIPRARMENEDTRQSCSKEDGLQVQRRSPHSRMENTGQSFFKEDELQVQTQVPRAWKETRHKKDELQVQRRVPYVRMDNADTFLKEDELQVRVPRVRMQNEDIGQNFFQDGQELQRRVPPFQLDNENIGHMFLEDGSDVQRRVSYRLGSEVIGQSFFEDAQELQRRVPGVRLENEDIRQTSSKEDGIPWVSGDAFLEYDGDENVQRLVRIENAQPFLNKFGPTFREYQDDQQVQRSVRMGNQDTGQNYLKEDGRSRPQENQDDLVFQEDGKRQTARFLKEETQPYFPPVDEWNFEEDVVLPPYLKGTNENLVRRHFPSVCQLAEDWDETPAFSTNRRQSSSSSSVKDALKNWLSQREQNRKSISKLNDALRVKKPMPNSTQRQQRSSTLDNKKKAKKNDIFTLWENFKYRKQSTATPLPPPKNLKRPASSIFSSSTRTQNGSAQVLPRGGKRTKRATI